MNIGFIMYDWKDIDPELDSSFRLVHECVIRNHKVSIIYSSEMFIQKNKVCSYCHIVNHKDVYSSDMNEFYEHTTLTKEFQPMGVHDVIFLRDNPPLDFPMLNFLDSLNDSILFINSLSGIRKANNKIYPASFNSLFNSKHNNNKLVPTTSISRNKEYLKQVINEYEGDKLILKPIDGFGGTGIILLDKSSKSCSKNINSLLDFYIDYSGKNNYILLQEYIEPELKGDIRIIMLNGKPLGSIRRIPADDDHRSNYHAGGRFLPHKLSTIELELCSFIGPQLVKDGLYLVGIDVMGGKLIEVNPCSPGGIKEINEFNDSQIQIDIINFVERKINSLIK
jgi:glutathione synthase